ncbi:hypothetical protein BG004_006552 [Podila humilis]|nr:hypothetical protein BG004_006552 [Podila humilis]
MEDSALNCPEGSFQNNDVGSYQCINIGMDSSSSINQHDSLESRTQRRSAGASFPEQTGYTLPILDEDDDVRVSAREQLGDFIEYETGNALDPLYQQLSTKTQLPDETTASSSIIIDDNRKQYLHLLQQQQERLPLTSQQIHLNLQHSQNQYSTQVPRDRTPHEETLARELDSEGIVDVKYESNNIADSNTPIPLSRTQSTLVMQEHHKTTRAKFRTNILARLRPHSMSIKLTQLQLQEQEYQQQQQQKQQQQVQALEQSESNPRHSQHSNTRGRIRSLDAHHNHHQRHQQHQHHQQQAHVHHPRSIKVEYIPVIWDAENERPETRPIPGLEQPLCFPPDLAQTVLRLQNEPPPMTNYLAHVAHNEVRSWSAALNLTTVHRILGGVRPSWQIRLQMFLKRLPRRIIGQNRQGGRNDGNGASVPGANGNNNSDPNEAGTGISRYLQYDYDGWEEEDDDLVGVSAHGRRRWRGHGRRRKRNKNLWTARDVDYLELLLLFYTSSRIESLSLGMTCSHWYHPSLDFLVPGVPERLSGLRRIVIDHADSVLHSTISVPQLFIARHQAAFPGQLREIQIRQSYHYSYDMSKSVLEIIQTIKRLEVLDLSIWTNVFTGLDSISTTFLRKLLICHHMEVVQLDMFDPVLERCLLLEELSIVVPHPRLFKWAVERKRNRDAAIRGALAASSPSSLFPGGNIVSALDMAIKHESSQGNHNLLKQRKITRWSGGSQDLPPLKVLTLFGQTPDIVEAFRDVMWAFQDTLESVLVSMHPNLNKQQQQFEVLSPPHFMVPTELDIPPFIDMDVEQDPMEDTMTNPAGSSSLGAGAYQPHLQPHYYQEPPPWVVIGGSGEGQAQTQGLGQSLMTSSWPTSSSSSSTSSSVSTASSLLPLSASMPLSWDWTMPKLRTMSLRGPPVLHFDLGMIRRCPQLTDLALSLHCSRLPRLIFPRHLLQKAAGTWAPLVPEEVASSLPSMTCFPKVMICDSLAFKWGMTLNEDRRSLVVL